LNSGPSFSPNEAVSFQVMTGDQSETDRYWNAIIENGGNESQCGWRKGRPGFSWQIVPRVLIAELNDADHDATMRVMGAMMTMHRINIARLEAARAREEVV
jgi:predicted 3-demethylubiquinone-9 3-methyltransferase (glyoxalase superfamily)